jgi:hypothetical protein
MKELTEKDYFHPLRGTLTNILKYQFGEDLDE